MATIHTFYLAPEDWHPPFTLSGQEAHHLDRVLRIRVGASVRLINGEGKIGFFTVARKEKNHIFLDIESEKTTEKPAARHTLAAGFSKELRRGWFLEKAVELEADSLWFWQGDHSQHPMPETEKESWKTSIISGAKQCESPWIPSVKMLPGGIEELIAHRAGFDRAFLLYERDTGGRILTKEELASSGDTLLVVGPEGGFSSRETTALIHANFIPVSLGNRVLRWETAAIMVLGLAWWARQQP